MTRAWRGRGVECNIERLDINLSETHHSNIVLANRYTFIFRRRDKGEKNLAFRLLHYIQVVRRLRTNFRIWKKESEETSILSLTTVGLQRK